MPRSQDAFCRFEKTQYQSASMTYQWVPGTSGYCRQCRCYSSVQDHPHKHLPKIAPFMSKAAAASRSYMFSGSPPTALGRRNAYDPPSAPHHVLLGQRGSLQSSDRRQLSGSTTWISGQYSYCRTSRYLFPFQSHPQAPPAVTGQQCPSGWQG